MELQNKLKKLKDEMTEKIEEYSKYCHMVEEYSRFEIKSLGNILAEIITFYEGKKYICKEVEMKHSQCDYDDYGDSIVGTECSESFKRLALVDENDECNRIILPPTNSLDWFFYLYDSPVLSILDGTNMFSALYPYLKDFIDYVIYYRMENDISNLAPEILEELKKSFLAGYSREERIIKKVIN